jgi:hypothetical protein
VALQNHEIGRKKCWVCGSELPLMLFPEGCAAECAPNLRFYEQELSLRYYLCDRHGFILWTGRQRQFCLSEIKKLKGSKKVQ